MYSVSDAVRAAIRQPDRTSKWIGTITCTDGTAIEFDQGDMIKSNGGTITRKVSSGTGLELGSACAGQLDLNLILDVSRYILYDAVIGLYYLVRVDISTWGDLEEYTWYDLTHTTWGEVSGGIYVPIPMGVFNVAEVVRTSNRLQIVAYDNMLKFDESISTDSTARIAYDWLTLACEACDVGLGMTLAETKALPNGKRKLALASGTVEDCKTWRDMIRYLAAAMCSVAQIDRFGKLVLIPYGTESVLSFPATWRYSSKFSDFQTYYTGLYATYKDGGLSEYFSADDVTDDGLVYNLGVNPFLQVSRAYARQDMAKNIINALSTLKYAPFSASVPCDPTLDPMDVINFTGMTASSDDLGALTEIVCRINGKMGVSCAGENPLLNAAKSRYTKNIEGLLSGDTYSGGVSGTSDFWMVFDDNSDADQTISSTETVVCSLEITPKTDHTKSQVNFTVTYTLDEASTVVADVQVDGVSIYSVSDDQTAGNHTLTVTCGEAWDDTDTHEVNVLLSATPITEGTA